MPKRVRPQSGTQGSIPSVLKKLLPIKGIHSAYVCNACFDIDITRDTVMCLIIKRKILLFAHTVLSLTDDF